MPKYGNKHSIILFSITMKTFEAESWYSMFSYIHNFVLDGYLPLPLDYRNIYQYKAV